MKLVKLINVDDSITLMVLGPLGSFFSTGKRNVFREIQAWAESVINIDIFYPLTSNIAGLKVVKNSSWTARKILR